jgi:inner membrane transporter RhtA
LAVPRIGIDPLGGALKPSNTLIRRIRRFRATAAPPELFFVVGAASQYLGAALAVLLFDRVAAAGMALLRVASAAVVLLIWRRPKLERTPRQWPLIAAFGTSLALLNLTFYLAIARVPVGTAVAIEFAGPVAVAAFGSRRARDWLALTTGVAGVLLVADAHFSHHGAGVALALLAGVFWAAYIVLGHRVAGAGAGVDSLALAMLVGALAIAPFTAAKAGPAFSDPLLLAAALGVGLLSSVVPYAIDQFTLRRLARHRFALTLAVLPATAAVIGSIVLGQLPTVGEVCGIVLVMAAIVLTQGTQEPDPSGESGG